MFLTRFTVPAQLGNNWVTTGKPAALLHNAPRYTQRSCFQISSIFSYFQDAYLKAGACVPRCGEGDRWEEGTCVPDQDQKEEYEYQPGEEDDDYGVEEEEYHSEYEDSDYDEEYKEEDRQDGESEVDPCSPNPCGQGECVHDGIVHRCRCLQGEEEKEGRCVQVADPCDANPPPCSQMCSSTSGAPRCSCRPGFQLLPGPGGICRDIDECRCSYQKNID